MSDSPIDQVMGLAFPFRVDPVTGRLETARGAEKVRQNVRVLLATRTGERPLNRDFGTRLRSFAQEPDDDVLREIIEDEVGLAFLRWEQRVLVTKASLLDDSVDGATLEPGEVRLAVEYRHVLDATTETAIVPL